MKRMTEGDEAMEYKAACFGRVKDRGNKWGSFFSNVSGAQRANPVPSSLQSN